MSGTDDSQGGSHCSRCTFEQLEALYQLNVEAKRYAESAEEAYAVGRKATARRDSLRKKALYGLKRAILGEFVHEGCVDTVRTHEIEGKPYYCLYVGEFSFHTPADEWSHPPLDASQSPTESLDAFDADPNNRTDHLSETEALQRLTEEFEPPNNHLETPFVDHEYSSEFAGWSDLPGAIEEGDRVDGRFNRKVNDADDEFVFAVGDSFQTREGKCEIVDRYQAWLPPWRDHSPIMAHTVYDVELAGEEHETVRQRRIVDEWHILLESLREPVPNADGGEADRIRNICDQVEFDIGDIVELRPTADEKAYYKITEGWLSSMLVMVEGEPVEPTDGTPLSLPVEEVADDVVAVHDEPPKTEQ